MRISQSSRQTRDDGGDSTTAIAAAAPEATAWWGQRVRLPNDDDAS